MIINVRTVLAANGTDFPLRDSLFETLTEPTQVEIGIAADATGVLATINAGPDTLAEESPVTVKTINLLPVYPDDFWSDSGLPQDKLSVKLRDTSGVQRIVMTQIRLTPILS